MKYKIYSFEIIDGDIDFLECIKEEDSKDTVEEAFESASKLDEEWEIKSKKEGLLRAIVHLVYDENDNRVKKFLI